MPKTLTLELSDHVAERLRDRATAQGETVETVASFLLAERLASTTAFDQNTVSAIREGIDDGKAGREQLFEDYVAEMKARRETRRMKQSE